LLAEGFRTAVAVVYGSALLALCELLAFAGEFSRGERLEVRVATRRIGWIAVALALGLAASTLALLGGSVRAPDIFVAVGIGMPASVGLIALIAAIYRLRAATSST
jgi:hypothetical protein